MQCHTCSSEAGGLGMKTFDSFGMFFQSLGLEHELIGVTFCKSEMSLGSLDVGGTDGSMKTILCAQGVGSFLCILWVWFKNMFSLYLLS